MLTANILPRVSRRQGTCEPAGLRTRPVHVVLRFDVDQDFLIQSWATQPDPLLVFTLHQV